MGKNRAHVLRVDRVVSGSFFSQVEVFVMIDASRI